MDEQFDFGQREKKPFLEDGDRVAAVCASLLFLAMTLLAVAGAAWAVQEVF